MARFSLSSSDIDGRIVEFVWLIIMIWLFKQ